MVAQSTHLFFPGHGTLVARQVLVRMSQYELTKWQGCVSPGLPSSDMSQRDVLFQHVG